MEYKLGKLLGQGSFGQVYELKNTDYAIKFIQPEKKNLLELYIVDKLKHSCIIHSINIEINVKGLIKVIFPKADYDLLHLLKKKVNYTLSKSICLDIIKGLQFLHSLKIIHGDIKPSNILIFNNKAKITDFSITRYENSKINTLLYTKYYRPPEYIYTTKSDNWALGLIIEELFKQYNKDIHLYDLLNKIFKPVLLRICINGIYNHPFFK